jgi:hypothetical protein
MARSNRNNWLKRRVVEVLSDGSPRTAAQIESAILNKDFKYKGRISVYTIGSVLRGREFMSVDKDKTNTNTWTLK